jgi:hypothetical protein
MKYLTVPAAVEVMNDQGKAVELTFDKFLADQVWPHPVWRLSKDNYDRFVECVGLFKDCKEGDVIELSDGAYEVFAPIASMRNEQLAPHNLLPLMQLIGAVLKATSEKP